MAKVKTNKTAQSRFRVTKKGKVLYTARGWNHLRSKKSKKVRHRKKGKRKLSSDIRRKVKKILKTEKNVPSKEGSNKKKKA